MLLLFLNPFTLLIALLLAGLAVVLAARTRAADKVGRVLAAELVDRRPRQLALLGVAVTAVLVIASREIELLAASFVILVPAALVIALSPADDRVCGENGVRFGWDALRFEELEEWRLTGDHLRFRTAGEWHAVPVPAASKDELRRRLTELAPDRESPFRY